MNKDWNMSLLLFLLQAWLLGAGHLVPRPGKWAEFPGTSNFASDSVAVSASRVTACACYSTADSAQVSGLVSTSGPIAAINSLVLLTLSVSVSKMADLDLETTKNES